MLARSTFGRPFVCPGCPNVCPRAAYGGAWTKARALCAGAVAVKHEVSRALSAIVSVFWVDSQTMNVPAPDDHALEPSVMKELAEKHIVEVGREIGGYDHEVCKASANTLMAGLTKSLVDLSKPFKYIGVFSHALCSACASPCRCVAMFEVLWKPLLTLRHKSFGVQ